MVYGQCRPTQPGVVMVWGAPLEHLNQTRGSGLETNHARATCTESSQYPAGLGSPFSPPPPVVYMPVPPTVLYFFYVFPPLQSQPLPPSFRLPVLLSDPSLTTPYRLMSFRRPYTQIQTSKVTQDAHVISTLREQMK